LKIAYFVWEYPPQLVGGLGTYAENMTKRLVRRGHEVCVFTLNTGRLPTRSIIDGVEVHRPLVIDASDIFATIGGEGVRRMGGRIKFFSDVLTYNILSVSKLIYDLVAAEGYSFDILSIHDWLSGMGGVIAKKSLKLPMVFHVHSTEWGRAGGGGSSVISSIEYETAKAADRVVTVSNAMQTDLERHGWPAEKISVVWNGVDEKLYNPGNVSRDEAAQLRQRYGVDEGDILILFVGRLTWFKGVRNLIQAMPLVLSEFPNVKLLVLGKGEEQRDLLELSHRLGISESVRFRFEFVDERERILHYAASDLAVFPSLYEPFGIVSLEAMALSKPVVVGARGTVGFREQVVPSGPEQNGVHVNGEDPADIAWGIKEVIRDPEGAKAMGRRGRERVLRLFTLDRSAEQTEVVYKEVLEEGR